MIPSTIVKPEGSAGSISQLATGPPEFDTVIVDIVTPRVYTWLDIVEIEGIISLTVIVKLVFTLPPELFA